MPNSNGILTDNNLKINQNNNKKLINENVKQQNMNVGVRNQSTQDSNLKSQPTIITDQDAIQLLAEDVESRLEALLRNFIQEEKLRQESRYNNLIGRRSASLNALNSDVNYSNSSYNDSLNFMPKSVNNNFTNKNERYNENTNNEIQQTINQRPSNFQLHGGQKLQNNQSKVTNHRLNSSNKILQNELINSQSKILSRSRSPSPSNRVVLNPVNQANVNKNYLGKYTEKKTQNTSPQNNLTNNKNNLNTIKQNNQPVKSNYLNLHQRSKSPLKDTAQNVVNNSSQLIQNQNNLNKGNSSHRLYSNKSNTYNLFGANNLSQLGRSKDDSHIRRVVVYNLSKDSSSVEKKPVVIESSKNKNAVLNNGFISNNNSKNVENITPIDNNAIKLKSAKTRASSPSRVGIINSGSSIVLSNNSATNKSTINNRSSNPANTNKLVSSLNNVKKLASNSCSKVTTSATANNNRTGPEKSLFIKDHNNNFDSNSVGSSPGGAQVNTERKLVRKLIVKELDGPNLKSENSVNNKVLNNKLIYQRPNSTANGDLNNVGSTTMNTQIDLSNSKLANVSKLDALLSERDRIINNRDQQKQQLNNFNILSNSDSNNNYIFKNNKSYDSTTNELSSSSSSSSINNSYKNSSPTAGLLQNNDKNLNNFTNRNLPLSSTASNSMIKRKPLIDRYCGFSLVNEARQRWEETVIKNGMTEPIPSRFNNLDHIDNLNENLNDNVDFPLFNSSDNDDNFADSSMILIRSRLSRMLNASNNSNGNVYNASNLPNSAVISLLNELSKSQNNLNTHEKSDVLLNNCLNNSSIHSMRPPHLASPSNDANGHSTSTGAQLNGIFSTSQNNYKTNTVKPFLSKGSVAERVMLFEKHPQLKQIEETEAVNRKEENLLTQRVNKSPLPYSSWREKNKNDVLNLTSSFEQNLRGRPFSSRKSINLQQEIQNFYFPNGKPTNNNHRVEQLTTQICIYFKTLKDGICTRENIIDLCKTSSIPVYWKEPLFSFVAQGNNYFSQDSYLSFWRKLNSNYFDEASKFIYILSKGKRNFILPEDFIPMIQDVINTHPGLLFLKYAIEFHSRYVHTVIARIYYTVNRSWSGRISINELRKSNFLQIVKLLQDEDDINQITDYFSYEHFYVIYCKFWGLDRDHDLIINKYDLSKHQDGAISSRMIERIFSGAVTQGKSRTNKQMTYQEFVYFLISEEDKKSDTAIEYWFRCLDLDGDGYLSLYELEYFYEEQVKRMESIGIEALPFNDCICQMLDMINPEKKNKISLSDLKKCSMSYIFLDTFFNLHKYLLHEQKDPFSNKDDQLQSDWDKYAAEEYENLVAEESSQNQNIENENKLQKKYTFDEDQNQDSDYEDYYDSTIDEDYDYILTDEDSFY